MSISSKPKFKVGDCVQIRHRDESWRGEVTAFDGNFYAVACPAMKGREKEPAWFESSLELSQTPIQEYEQAVSVLGEDYFA